MICGGETAELLGTALKRTVKWSVPCFGLFSFFLIYLFCLVFVSFHLAQQMMSYRLDKGPDQSWIGCQLGSVSLFQFGVLSPNGNVKSCS